MFSTIKAETNLSNFNKKKGIFTNWADVEDDECDKQEIEITHQITQMDDLRKSFSDEITNLIKNHKRYESFISYMTRLLVDSQIIRDDACKQHNKYNCCLSSKKMEAESLKAALYKRVFNYIKQWFMIESKKKDFDRNDYFSLVIPSEVNNFVLDIIEVRIPQQNKVYSYNTDTKKINVHTSSEGLHYIGEKLYVSANSANSKNLKKIVDLYDVDLIIAFNKKVVLECKNTLESNGLCKPDIIDIKGMKKLLPSQHSQIVESVRAKVDNLVFRRVETCQCADKNFLNLKNISHDNEVVYSNLGDYVLPENNEIFKFEASHNLQYNYSHFYGFTNTPVNNREYINDPIRFENNHYCEINYTTLEFKERGGTTLAPESRETNGEGDLLCGIVERDDRGVYHYAKWFICSEQFHRAVQLILNPDSNAFLTGKSKGKNLVKTQDKNLEAESGIYHHYMSGNRLTTANYKKWLAPREEKKMIVTEEEKRQRFYAIRTEKVSREYCHVYNAIVALVRWNELPIEDNVPKNIPGPNPKIVEINLGRWDLPENFIQNFVNTHCTLIL